MQTSEANGKKRAASCRCALDAMSTGELNVDRIMFSGETTARFSDTTHHPHLTRTWVGMCLRHKDFAQDLIAKPTSGFSGGVMASLRIAKAGFPSVAFCNPSRKGNQNEYVEMQTMCIAPKIMDLARDLSQSQSVLASTQSRSSLMRWSGLPRERLRETESEGTTAGNRQARRHTGGHPGTSSHYWGRICILLRSKVGVFCRVVRVSGEMLFVSFIFVCVW